MGSRKNLFQDFQCSWPGMTWIKSFSSEWASKMGLVVSWRQFPRNLEQNFDFPDFQGKQGTSCPKLNFSVALHVQSQFVILSKHIIFSPAEIIFLLGAKNDRMTVRVCFCRSESVFPLPKPCNVRIFQDGENSRSNLFSLPHESNNFQPSEFQLLAFHY